MSMAEKDVLITLIRLYQKHLERISILRAFND